MHRELPRLRLEDKKLLLAGAARPYRAEYALIRQRAVDTFIARVARTSPCGVCASPRAIIRTWDRVVHVQTRRYPRCAAGPSVIGGAHALGFGVWRRCVTKAMTGALVRAGGLTVITLRAVFAMITWIAATCPRYVVAMAMRGAVPMPRTRGRRSRNGMHGDCWP